MNRNWGTVASALLFAFGWLLTGLGAIGVVLLVSDINRYGGGTPEWLEVALMALVSVVGLGLLATRSFLTQQGTIADSLDSATLASQPDRSRRWGLAVGVFVLGLVLLIVGVVLVAAPLPAPWTTTWTKANGQVDQYEYTCDSGWQPLRSGVPGYVQQQWTRQVTDYCDQWGQVPDGVGGVLIALGAVTVLVGVPASLTSRRRTDTDEREKWQSARPMSADTEIPPNTDAPPKMTDDIEYRLQRLTRLRDGGTITESEYAEKRQSIIDEL